MANKKEKVELVSLRFSGNVNINLLNQVKDIAGEDMTVSEVMRYLIMIGLEAYKNGAVANFDGKVLLNQHANTVKEQQLSLTENVLTTNKPNQMIKEPSVKKSAFLD